MSFGTGGIRGLIAFRRAEIEPPGRGGLDAPILKGPNTLNNIVLLLTSSGVAAFGQRRTATAPYVIGGYDSPGERGGFRRPDRQPLPCLRL